MAPSATHFIRPLLNENANPANTLAKCENESPFSVTQQEMIEGK